MELFVFTPLLIHSGIFWNLCQKMVSTALCFLSLKILLRLVQRDMMLYLFYGICMQKDCY